MREIKFRARATEDRDGFTNRYYIYSDKYSSLSEFFCFTEAEGWIFYEQFTGLLDNSGKEIWEGDIANITYSEPTYPSDSVRDDISYTERGVMKWKEDTAQFAYSVLDSLMTEDMNNLKVEVLGNIYENPELLK